MKLNGSNILILAVVLIFHAACKKKGVHSQVDLDLTDVGQVPFSEEATASAADQLVSPGAANQVVAGIENAGNSPQTSDESRPLRAIEDMSVCEAYSDWIGVEGLDFRPLHQACGGAEEYQDKLRDLELAKDILEDLGTIDLIAMRDMDPEIALKCETLISQALRKQYRILRRAKKAEGRDLMKRRNDITEARLHRVLRRIDALSCGSLKADLASRNHIVNGSFELVNESSGDRDGLIDGKWTVLPGSNIPAWRVRQVAEDGVGVFCDQLEVHQSGTVVSSANGLQYIELDGHCVDEAGQLASGDARVEIMQSFRVSLPGTYYLKFYAAKRSGQFGGLKASVKISGEASTSEHTFDLDKSGQLKGHCLSVQIPQVSVGKRVTIKLWDNILDRLTYGALVDDIRFDNQWEPACSGA